MREVMLEKTDQALKIYCAITRFKCINSTFTMVTNVLTHPPTPLKKKHALYEKHGI